MNTIHDHKDSTIHTPYTRQLIKVYTIRFAIIYILNSNNPGKIRVNTNQVMPLKITLPNEILLSRAVQTVAEGKVAIIPVKGQSMFPFIHGDRDRVELYPPDDLKEGDVVLAEIKPSHYILHRIFHLENDKSITLMGDGNIDKFEHCSKEDIKAKALTIVYPNGHKKKLDSSNMKTLARIWKTCLPIRSILLKIFWKIYF